MTVTELVTLPLEECIARLASHQVGRIALVVDGIPLLVPVNYRLVELPGRYWVAIRTRPGGVIERAGTYVAFEIDEIDSQRHEGWSVVMRGTLHHVDPDAADFRARFDPQSWLIAQRSVWMVVEAFQITGRELRRRGGHWALDLSVADAPSEHRSGT